MNRVVSGGQYCCNEVAKAIRRGLLQHPKQLRCADCGGQAIEYDHRDYNKPLCVDPVCRRCNLLRGPAIPKRWLRDELMATLKRHCSGINWSHIPFAKMRCAAIEEATCGEVTKHDLRPDIFDKAKAA